MNKKEETNVRIPPQANDAEVAVLGAILLDSEAIAKSVEYLDDSNLYKETHKKIFAAMYSLYERNEPIDVLTLAEELKKRK